MTPEAIEAMALHLAAEVAHGNARGISLAVDILRKDGLDDEAKLAKGIADCINVVADAIHALAPMSPLQAALQVPEVKALAHAAMRVAAFDAIRKGGAE